MVMLKASEKLITQDFIKGKGLSKTISWMVLVLET
jgi:hypothetical protein